MIIAHVGRVQNLKSLLQRQEILSIGLTEIPECG